MPDPKPLPDSGLAKRTANLLKGGKKGNRGGHGGTPKAFKDFMRDEIRNGFKSRHALVQASQDPESKGFGLAWKLAADYDDEKPAQRTDITSKDKPITGVIILPPVDKKRRL